MHRVVCIERLRARRKGWWGNVTLFGFGRSSPFAAIGLLSTTSGQARCCHHVYFLDLPMVYSCIVAPIDNHWSGDELSCHSTRLLANDHTRQPMNWAEIFGISGREWWYILLLEQFFWSQQTCCSQKCFRKTYFTPNDNIPYNPNCQFSSIFSKICASFKTDSRSKV